MSRHGYSDYGWESAEDQWAYIRYRGALKSALRGKRGQQFLRDLIDALDAMPEKRLVAGALVLSPGDVLTDEWGDPISGPLKEEQCGVCALGALGQAKGIDDADLRSIAGDDWEELGSTFNVAEVLAREVMFQNDDFPGLGFLTPEQRWQSVRDWAKGEIRAAASSADTEGE